MNEDVKQFFDEIAFNYAHEDTSLIDELLDSMYFSTCKRILDLACGKGIISKKLAERNNGEVIALDLSSEMIKYAKDRVNDPRVTFINQDYYSFNADPFDAIICFDAFPHFLDVEGFVEKTNQLLKDDGLLVIAHDIGRGMLNTHHKQQAMGISRRLKTPEEEMIPFLKYFKPIELTESENYYKLIMIKK